MAPMINVPERSSQDAAEPSDVPQVLSQIASLGAELRAEFDLISGRMSWLVVSESFIFSAFATSVANYRPDHGLVGILRYLAWVLPVVGIVLAASVYLAVIAAMRAIDGLKNQRDRMMKRLPLELQIDLISAQSRDQWWGNLPVYVIPPVLLLVWAIGLVLAIL